VISYLAIGTVEDGSKLPAGKEQVLSAGKTDARQKAKQGIEESIQLSMR
jgi:hypothetical protein